MSKAKELAQWIEVYSALNFNGIFAQAAAELRRLDALEKEGNDYLTIAYLSGHSKGVADTKAKLEQAAEPVMIYHGRCTIDCGEHGHQDVEMLKMIPAGSKLYTHPAPRKPMTEEDVSKWQGDHDVVMSIKAYKALLKLVGVERNQKIKE